MSPKSWVKPEEVYSMKPKNGFPVFLIKSGNVFYIYGKFPDMRYKRGLVYPSNITNFVIRDSKNREYRFSGIYKEDLKKQLLKGIYGPSYDAATKLSQLLEEKEFITGMDLYRYPKAKEFLRSKGVKETRNFFISLEKETPIVVLQQIDEMNYRVIIDTYKMIVDKTPQNVEASKIYEKLS